jgi:soluble lytic murein transglycosylase-like protein
VALGGGHDTGAAVTSDPPAARRAQAATVLFGLAVLAALPGRAVADVGEACRDQAAIAERANGIPDGLLLAIGKRESGRFDMQAGDVLPWPWSVDREGEGRFFASLQEAAAYVATAEREGSTSIDVGCFQINLKYHPIAFASLDAAFDPAANAAYAARFLRALYDREGSWETAVAYYHSASPLLSVPYREAVFATWHGLAQVAATRIRPLPFGAVRVVMGIRIYTGGEAYLYPAAIPVSAATAAGSPAERRPVRGLPRVITPSGGVARLRVGT